jgi:hypothetical protein
MLDSRTRAHSSSSLHFERDAMKTIKILHGLHIWSMSY